MAQEPIGNIRGLAPSELKRLKRLYTRAVPKDELVTLDLARELAEMGTELRRMIALLVSREGHVEYVVVGTREIFYLPDLGRFRVGAGRLRRLRLIFSDLSSEGDAPKIPTDVYTDLEKLRFDAVVSVRATRSRVSGSFAHIAPVGSQGQGSQGQGSQGQGSQGLGTQGATTEVIPDLGRFELEFIPFIEQLEDELHRAATLSLQGAAHGALLVAVYERNRNEVDSSLAELAELARTAGVKVIGTVTQKVQSGAKTFIGKGKLEEVILTSLRLGADMVIFDTELKPAQWRVITNATELKVLDRSMLILDIFASRAQSSEGRLQVELAQLRYNLPRLVEKDQGLSRLSGGIGGRGPGETKLEIGRRRIRDRITDLERRIEKLAKERKLRSSRMREQDLPLVSILGYTNVGKSTLFNALTGSSVIAENKLFATLDPSRRRLFLGDPAVGDRTEVILSDTVGFIRKLPAELMNAFRATLDELRDAALLVHVLDASDPHIKLRKKAVDEILQDMELTDLPMIVVVNKLDLIPEDDRMPIVSDYEALGVAAARGEGLVELKRAIRARLDEIPATPVGDEVLPLS